MTRDAEHTPSHPSVVVPLEDWQHVIGALKNAKARLPMGAAIGNVSDALSKVEHLQAAPAPSSLAGGEVTNDQIQSVMLAAIKEVRATVTDATEGACMDADIIRMERGTVDMGGTGWAVMRAVHRRLAALSPEAPARVGGEWFGVTGAADEAEALAVALFDARCPGIRMTDEDLHYYRAAAQRAMQAVADELDTPALTPRHEAPAEGAGELDRAIRRMRNQLVGSATFMQLMFGREDVRKVLDALEDLRARSSAPEAREAVARVVSAHGDPEAFGEREIEVLTDLSRIPYNTPLYTHPAAQSADKLREALEDIKSAADSFRDCEGDEVAHQVIIRCDQALAALKAEGA